MSGVQCPVSGMRSTAPRITKSLMSGVWYPVSGMRSTVSRNTLLFVQPLGLLSSESGVRDLMQILVNL